MKKNFYAVKITQPGKPDLDIELSAETEEDARKKVISAHGIDPNMIVYITPVPLGKDRD